MFHLGFAREKVKSFSLISNVCVGNATDCHEQHVAWELRFEHAYAGGVFSALKTSK
jgi:hypothetical protein